MFSTGSISSNEHTKFVEALANRMLSVCKSFEIEVDVANKST
jgi:hypothetical protein